MNIVDAIDGNKQPLLSTVLSAALALAVGIDTAVSRTAY
jgi:hypothetical protein